MKGLAFCIGAILALVILSALSMARLNGQIEDLQEMNQDLQEDIDRLEYEDRYLFHEIQEMVDAIDNYIYTKDEVDEAFEDVRQALEELGWVE